MKYIVILGVTLAALGLGLDVRQVRACSRRPCGPGLLVPTGGTVPANLPGAFWNPGQDNSGHGPFEGDYASRVRVFHIGRTLEPVAFTLESVVRNDRFLVRFAAPLLAGDSYRIEADDLCGDEVTTLATQFRAGPEAAWPDPANDSLGELIIDEPRNVSRLVGTTSGQCTTEVDAVSATIELVLSDALAPWADALSHLRGGEGGKLVDAAFHICDDEPGTEANSITQQIVWTATLPGATGRFTTATTQVSLPCGPFASCSGSPELPSVLGLVVMVLGLRRRARLYD